MKWRRNRKKDLLRRIRKIGLRKTFSVREIKLLRKLINQQVKEGFIDFEAIHGQFPGKTIEQLKEKYNQKFDYLKRRGRKSS